jgi:uncharacterized protein YecE (DUF72 family)
LIQLPPWCGFEQFRALRTLVESLPRVLQFAVEFRAADWRREATFQLLEDHNIALVGLDHEEHTEQADLRTTSDVVYLRLVGKHGRYEDLGHETYDPTERLSFWLDKVRRASPVREAWVLFNNDFAGHAPATLRRFAALAGVELPTEIRQGTLF